MKSLNGWSQKTTLFLIWSGFFKKKIWGQSPFRGATDSPDLDFWWRLPWVSLFDLCWWKHGNKCTNWTKRHFQHPFIFIIQFPMYNLRFATWGIYFKYWMLTWEWGCFFSQYSFIQSSLSVQQQVAKHWRLAFSSFLLSKYFIQALRSQFLFLWTKREIISGMLGFFST